MDEMNKYPEIKDHYLIMGNEPIHTTKLIREMIKERGYNYLYLPYYSPELNPIEQFWSILESAIKSIPQSALDRFAHYSVKRFDGCLLERPI
jgi:transposase